MFTPNFPSESNLPTSFGTSDFVEVVIGELDGGVISMGFAAESKAAESKATTFSRFDVR